MVQPIDPESVKPPRFHRPPEKPYKPPKHRCNTGHINSNPVGTIWGPCPVCGGYKVVKRGSNYTVYWKRISKRRAIRRAMKWKKQHANRS